MFVSIAASLPASTDILSKLKGEIKTEDITPELLEKLTQEIKSANKSADSEVDNLIKIEELNEKKNHNDNLKQARELRQGYATKVFWLTCSWTVAIFTVLILDGCGVLKLSEKVLITLITSTTINFFSFFYLVMRYLFRANTTDKMPSKLLELGK